MKNKTVILLLILVIGAFLRFYNLNWDQNQHLHPDERFLTMVGNAMKSPTTILQYLDPATSTFNPANIGFNFYVYGAFPVVLNKILAIILQTDNYNAFTLQGRFLSGLFDLMIVFLIYKTTQLFEKKYKLDTTIKYYAAFFYAIAVLPIQLSHFFAVDTFLNFFMFASFYFILKFSLQKKIFDIFLSAIFLGLALASKITALFIIPLVLFFIIYSFWEKPRVRNIFKTAYVVFIFGIISYLSLRLADPYLFESNNIFDLRISTLFIENLKLLSSWSKPDVWYPPSVQWIHKSPFFAVFNMAFFGLGILYLIIVLIGVITILVKYKKTLLTPVLAWVIVIIIYQSLQVSKTIRYFIILYPYLAIYAAIGFYAISKKWNNIFKVTLIFFISLWTLFFFSIYTKKHSRVEASEWIYKNIPNQSVLLSEHWDDSLPMSPDRPPDKQYILEQMPVFGPDTPEKWRKMDTLLEQGDYIVLSSNRGWGSIPLAPERYPKMTKFYKNLFAGKTQYKKIKEIHSYPSLNYLGIPLEIPDDLAEEAFTVFDHPKVMIFKKVMK